MSNIDKLTVTDLKKYDFFKLNKNSKTFKVFKNLIKLPNTVPDQFKGKSLIILNNCKQIIVNDNDVCYVKTNF